MKTVMQFLCYSPQIYSGLDKYILLLSEKMRVRGFNSIVVFTDTTDKVPQIRQYLETAGVKVEIIPSSGKLKIIASVWKLYVKYRPDIVHAHFINLVKAITALFSIIFRARHFTSFHSMILPFSSADYRKQNGLVKSYLLSLYLRYLHLASRRIFTVSEAIRIGFFDISKIKKGRVQTLYLGVEIKQNNRTKVELRRVLKLPEDKVLLCNLSAIDHIKGIDILCKAVAVLKRDYKLTDFVCCHFGGLRVENEKTSAYRDLIYNLSKELNIEDEMIFLGQRNDIGEILSAFDIYVHPSRMEGLGVALVEGATQSLPLIGSNVGGIPEIVQDRVNGYIIGNENIEQLAQCMYRLISDENMRKEMGAKSFEIVNEKFNIERQTEKLIDRYLS